MANEKFSPVLKTIGIFLLLGLVGYAFLNLGERVIPGSGNRSTTSIEPVTLTLTTDNRYREETGRNYIRYQSEWRIPKAYMINTKNWKGGDQFSIEMSLVLPDMEPLALVPNKQGVDTVSVRINKILVLSRESDFYSKMSKPTNERYHSEYVFTHTDDGMQYFREKGCLKEDKWVSCVFDEYDEVRPRGRWQYLIPSPETVQSVEDWARIRTSNPFLKDSRVRVNRSFTEEEKQNYIGNEGCTIKIDYKGHLITYIMRRRFLPQRREIERKLRELLDAFWLENRIVKDLKRDYQS